jgi:hypothetical protein
LDVPRLTACTRFNLGPYYVSLALHFLDGNGLPKFKKCNSWNLDETNNQLRKKKAKTVDHQDVKKSIKKEPVRMANTTVTFCINAEGDVLRVQMIHKGAILKKIPVEYKSLSKYLYIVCTKSGRQTKISFAG